VQLSNKIEGLDWAIFSEMAENYCCKGQKNVNC